MTMSESIDTRYCNICSKPDEPVVATVDGKTVFGPWGWMCDICHVRYGVGLGTGKGQRLAGAPLMAVTK
jgi:hypothetical protein